MSEKKPYKIPTYPDRIAVNYLAPEPGHELLKLATNPSLLDFVTDVWNPEARNPVSVTSIQKLMMQMQA